MIRPGAAVRLTALWPAVRRPRAMSRFFGGDGGIYSGFRFLTFLEIIFLGNRKDEAIFFFATSSKLFFFLWHKIPEIKVKNNSCKINLHLLKTRFGL